MSTKQIIGLAAGALAGLLVGYFSRGAGGTA
jgi:hypothetical protein